MKIERRLGHVEIKWKTVDVSIPGSDFKMIGVVVPEHWSETAINIIAQKYFRKDGISLFTRVSELDVPIWLQRSQRIDGSPTTHETSAKQVFGRLAGHWTYVGWKQKYFDTETDAYNFYSDIYTMLAMQMAAPNSPQWFNTGLWWAYGIEGPNSGQWAIDYGEGGLSKNQAIVYQIQNSYQCPQPHACFIQPVDDDLVNPGGIMPLWTNEVRLFKHGSGTGTNFSAIRGKNEKLSGGGVSSGLMSFLEIGDRAAGAIKSGGTTRRAAKMVIIDLDHPEIEDFIDWKIREEQKAAAMYVGSEIIARVANGETLPVELPAAVLDRIREGFESEVFSIAWEGEAIKTISGQNSNNSIRITSRFLRAVDNDEDWNLIARTDGSIVKTLKAKDLWTKICRAAWASGDPGLQFHDIINEYNTCPMDGEINASNPCSEYMFLNNTACNLASLNLARFIKPDVDNSGEWFDVDMFLHTVKLWTVVLDISVTMASFPSREIAEGSWKYRTLGLGYANLGGLLMRRGIPYDSDLGRQTAALITSLMHGKAYLTSAELAKNLGSFPRFEANKASMLLVINKHYYNFSQLHASGFLWKRAKDIWEDLLTEDEFRNAQVTLIAPTGTIGYVMDCDVNGIEPEFSLKKTKSLVGGGTIISTNNAVAEGLKNLKYKKEDISEILNYVSEIGTVEGCKKLNPEHYDVFSCAVPAVENGKFIRPIAHILMVSAVQPFLSGAVSKTVNMPNNSTIEDIDSIYREAFKHNLKSVALYRDGSKLTQPLNVQRSNSVDLEAKIANEIIKEMNRGVETNTIFRGGRESLLPRRRGYTQKYKVDGQTLYLRTGEYEDGRLGEIFVTLSREGSAARGFMEAFAKAISIGIQYGVPLKEYVDAFTFTKFEPAGIVQGHDRIKICSSLVDLIFRDIGISYLGMTDLANVTTEEHIKQDLSSNKEEPKSNHFSGEFCHCGGILIQDGTCKTCRDCGERSGGCG